MKTKEIDVWAVMGDEDRPLKMWSAFPKDYGSSDNGEKWLKAKLIIELPERKVEISESDLDDCYSDFLKDDTCGDIIGYIKQRLFKD
jgi:hypothetical protein